MKRSTKVQLLALTGLVSATGLMLGVGYFFTSRRDDSCRSVDIYNKLGACLVKHAANICKEGLSGLTNAHNRVFLSDSYEVCQSQFEPSACGKDGAQTFVYPTHIAFNYRLSNYRYEAVYSNRYGLFYKDKHEAKETVGKNCSTRSGGGGGYLGGFAGGDSTPRQGFGSTGAFKSAGT